MGGTEILRLGDPAPDGNGSFAAVPEGGLEPAFRAPGIDANAQDQVAFAVRLRKFVFPFLDETIGIYRWNGSTLERLVREGDPAPDGNGTFAFIRSPVFLGERGEVLFGAELEGTTGFPTDIQGLFVVLPDGAIEQVARTGMALAGSTAQFVSSLGFFSAPVSPAELASAGMKSIGDTGQVAFTAWLTDDRRGLFLTTVPEPGSTALPLAALAVLGVLRAYPSRP